MILTVKDGNFFSSSFIVHFMVAFFISFTFYHFIILFFFFTLVSAARIMNRADVACSGAC